MYGIGLASCTNMISTHALAAWAVVLTADFGQAFIPTGCAGVSPFIASSGHRGVAVTPTGSRRCRARGHVASMASSVAPAPRTKAEKKSEHFKLTEGGMVEFGSGQRVEVSVCVGREKRKKWVVGVVLGVASNIVVREQGKQKKAVWSETKKAK